MRDKVTDYQAKKTFAILSELCPGIPPLYIDEYWDNDIELIGEKERWEKFLYDFKKSGLTFTSYKEEIIQMADEYNNYLIKNLIRPGDIFMQISELGSEIINDKLPYLDRFEIPAGKYICVDICSTYDTTLKKAGILNESFNTSEIIKKMTPNDVFYSKDTRLWMYRLTINNRRNMSQNMFDICNALVLKELFNSDEPVIKHLNENYKFVGVNGDSILYKVNNDNYKNLLGKHTYKDIAYHIDEMIINDIEVFGNAYRGVIHDNKIYAIYNFATQTKNIHPYFVKKLLNQEITDLDRAVGYEDEIFFFIDK